MVSNNLKIITYNCNKDQKELIFITDKIEYLVNRD